MLTFERRIGRRCVPKRVFYLFFAIVALGMINPTFLGYFPIGTDVCIVLGLLVAGEVSILGYNHKKMQLPDAQAPAWWNEEKEADLLSTVTIGIISTSTYHHQVKNAAMASWWTEERRNMVTVFSDEILPFSGDIPNYFDTGCPNTYYRGIWCKNGAMIEQWKSDAKYKNVKWFVRVMDDTYLHLENLYDLVSQYDWREKILLGDKYCVVANYTYPSGGPGFIISRGLLDDWNWADWKAPLFEEGVIERRFVDDVLWGEYLARRKIPITNHYGITQSPLDLGGQLMQYFLTFKHTPWALPFRPVAIHAQKRANQMQFLHKILHDIPYEPQAQTLISLPDCTCRPSSHQKCAWNHKLVDLEICRWASQSLICFGPGPWPNLGHEYWHNEDMCA